MGSGRARWVLCAPVVLSVLALCGGVPPTGDLLLEYCVIGAGPAGLQMAYFLQRSQRHYLVLERSNISGSFFTRYPRHRRLISINKRYTGKANREFNLRHDWNSLLSHDQRLLFRRYSTEFFPHADTMLSYLNDYSRLLELKVRYNTEVTGVQVGQGPEAWHGHYYYLTDQNHQRYSVLLVATGMWVPNTSHFPGEQYLEGYEDVSVNPEDFAGQSVLILGRGNAAFETADNMVGHTNFIHMLSRSRVRLAWNTHYVGDIRAVNNALLDTYQLKSLDGQLERSLDNIRIERDKQGRLHLSLSRGSEQSNVSEEATGSEGTRIDNVAIREPYHRIIRCLGWKFDFSIFGNDTKPQVGSGRRRKYPVVSASYESQPGMFVIGTAAHSIDYRKSAGGFIHGFRYTTRAVHRLLDHRYHGVDWPATALPISQLTNAITKRVNEASGLYQMFSVLADVVLIQKNGTQFEYLEEYPIGALPDLQENTGKRVEQGLFVINLEYGNNFSRPDSDIFSLNRAVGEPRHAWLSNFLHPVIYYYTRLPTELEMRYRPHHWSLPRPRYIHHIVEDFLTDWTAANSHILPLRRFLENCLGTDLRSFFAESCFKFALTSQHVPPFCRGGYLEQRGLMGDNIPRAPASDLHEQ
ncbi:FAD-dependent oxidoreductase domain-containing protein 2 isoform X2 [Callorhinchus milii]|uniref:FAD-dependent oxidoreductase domain-containing protein 2 isoform X2 n=1 Tax=Callorhinchus milii TaxID=7868 RepID=UPI001C3F808F|nr:FAD-dependent oxidoreductase domain-containing protein 2 isoform X2 [Callorhinchus milii]